jgi:major membrane immunogen (membrane-anchored lipoprotein)
MIGFLSRASSLVVLLFAALLLAACSSGQDLTLAETEVAHFHQQMAAQQFAEIYAQATDDLKKTTAEDKLTRLLSAIDRKLGAVKSSDRTSWGVNFNTSGTTVTLKFKTTFERGTGDENFVYRIVGGKAVLAGYHINSDDLITNSDGARI